ncbi:hypothetical protein D3C78_1863680 [compost metagenome]
MTQTSRNDAIFGWTVFIDDFQRWMNFFRASYDLFSNLLSPKRYGLKGLRFSGADRI